MGRYANFSTGFEYKFAFAIQASEDISKFGGSALLEVHNLYERHHMWRKYADFQTVWDRLLRLDYVPEKELREFLRSYEKTLEGTERLCHEIYDFLEKQEKRGAELLHFFVLGVFIWHQLQYTQTLYVSYET